MKRQFKNIDKNKDGKISQAELKAEVELTTGTTVDHAFIKEIMEKTDLDLDGSVSFSEFMTSMINKKLLQSRENLVNVFNVFDKNGDGEIDNEELKKILSNT